MTTNFDNVDPNTPPPPPKEKPAQTHNKNQRTPDRIGIEPSVIVDNVSVVYHVTGGSAEQQANTTLGQKLNEKLLGRPPKYPLTAVKDLTFVAYKGDSIGLIGPNGAGKSTLLRIIAGAESPAAGNVWADSQPVLQGVSAALLPQLSGLENARLGCLAMGMTPEQADDAVPDIIEFSSLGDAINRPMESYSSGMAARLRFAISTAIRPEILLIDEALATGDASFQAKSRNRMEEMLTDAGTIFIVSHSLATIRQMCNRAIWLLDGEIIADGPPDEIAKHYARWARWSVHNEPDKMKFVARGTHRDFPPEIISVEH